MVKIFPSFTFSGQCAEAIELYKKAFGAKELGRMRFSEMSPRLIQYKQEQKNFIYQCQIQIDEQVIVLADDLSGWLTDDAQGKTGNTMMQNIKIRFDSDEDLQAAYNVLADGGTIIMPMTQTGYAQSHVFLIDKFGGRWELQSPPKSDGKCLSVEEIAPMAHDLLKNAGFDYCICGGYALDMFVGKEIRPHGDFDIVVFKEDQSKAIQFLMDNDWPVYVRFPTPDDLNSFRQFRLVRDANDTDLHEGGFWSVKPDSFAEMIKKEGEEDAYTYYIHEPRLQGFDFIEIAFDIREGNDFVVLEEPRVVRSMDKAILHNKDGIPYLAPEIILFFKSDKFSQEHPYLKPKTEFDFKAVMPLLPEESRAWLLNAIDTAFPDGHEWLDELLK